MCIRDSLKIGYLLTENAINMTLIKSDKLIYTIVETGLRPVSTILSLHVSIFILSYFYLVQPCNTLSRHFQYEISLKPCKSIFRYCDKCYILSPLVVRNKSCPAEFSKGYFYILRHLRFSIKTSIFGFRYRKKSLFWVRFRPNRNCICLLYTSPSPRDRT